MSDLVDRINALRFAASAKHAPDVAAKADALRKEIVATKEGGAITGEERLREKTDELYGAVNQTEGAPTQYALARIDALDHELSDVETSYTGLTTTDLPALNAKLKAKSLPALTAGADAPAMAVARGGAIEALFRAMVGARFTGTLRATASGDAHER
jgi:hypothetical protein